MANQGVGQDELLSVVEQLQGRLHQLEERVAVLEGHKEQPSTVLSPVQRTVTIPPIQRDKPPATWRGFPPAKRPAGTVPVLGKAVLGIAGAYLLRAIAESGTMPKLPVLAIAIAYAGLWLFWAARNGAQRFAGVTYAVTSAMILCPLLWESTVRFQALAPPLAACALVGFIILALGLAWRRNLPMLPWIAVLASVFTALGLIVQTRDFVPFTAALLAIAAATEFAALLGESSGIRIPPALFSDLALGLLLVVMVSPEGIGEGFQRATPLAVTALSIALLAIYGISIGVHAFWRQQTISVFEIVQAVVAFALAVSGALLATHGSAAPALGAVFLLLSAVCYWGALSRFLDEAQHRNRRVSASWAAGLFISGSLLLLPVGFALAFLCVAAVTSALVYTRTGKFSLGLHASLYLAAAGAIGPLPMYVVNALAGTVPLQPGWGVWLVALSAAVCYFVGARRTEAKRRRRVLWLVPAVLAGFALAGMTVAAIVFFAGHRLDVASRLSVIRTVVNCGLALALGLAGARLRRVELGWAAYTAVGFGALKLLFEDLRFGNAASLVISLLFYGLVLILLPRLTRQTEAESEAAPQAEEMEAVSAETSGAAAMR